ncbi:methyl-accepting chemotaxis protein [Rubellicoccus peritrichatus]|uniref:Methyl-accepting chemotaxis protein n=1 Tax=Rubellicoccus peritrichatus TaxID=3080537 RepID=A0AAQ3LCZ1_9BACT|nr:methyl-accepting chemotaxis protein [Puniceicoccus sp. CR14]WOO39694.1 methyl-accepting chemotaxis protein [Puniceicoccus sp. CR14]
MKLRYQVIVYLFLPLLLLATILASTNLYRDHKRMLEKDIALMEEELEKAALKLDSDNLEAVTVARTIAASQESGLFGERKESASFLQKVLENNPKYIGVSIAYEPNADGKDEASLTAWDKRPAWLGEDGRFLPYWYRDLDDGARIKVQQLVSMDTALYYQGVREAYFKNPELPYLITEPYTYNTGNLIIEQMSPIVIDGAFKGVCGVDRSLDYMQEYLEKLKDQTFASAEYILVSGGGHVVASTYDEDLRTISTDDLYVDNVGGKGQFVTNIFYDDGERKVPDEVKKERLLANEPDVTYRELFHGYSLRKVNTVPMEFDDPLSGQEAYIASAYIKTGGWRLIMTVSKDEITGPTRQAILYTAASGILGMLIMILLVLVFTNRFSIRIEKANSIAQAVAKGDLTGTVTVDSKDETGQLLLAIQSMVDSLNALLLQVKQSTIQLVSTATRITGTAKSQEATIQDFGTSTTEIAAAVNEISATSRELYNTMSGISDSSGETASMAESGRHQLTGMGQTMEGLSDATQSISAKLAVITEKAQNINKVVTTISKVSEQTNLLSLNAAIEAEKAGEYGLGFAVVAREIRRLANLTAQATVDIKSIVGDMQSAVSVGVMEMDRFSVGVRGGVAEIRDLGGQLEAIIDRVEHLSPRFDSVKEGMLSQTQGAQQISEAMTQLKDGAQRSGDSLKEFDKATKALHQAVNNLRSEVSRFKVSDRNATGVTRMPFPMGAKKASKKKKG